MAEVENCKGQKLTGRKQEKQGQTPRWAHLKPQEMGAKEEGLMEYTHPNGVGVDTVSG